MRVTNLVGVASDEKLGERLHALSHAGQVEYVILSRADMGRHRLRVTGDKGTECAIALPRSEKLANGAVLLLESTINGHRADKHVGRRPYAADVLGRRGGRLAVNGRAGSCRAGIFRAGSVRTTSATPGYDEKH